MFFNGINNFRALAIFLIVCGHCFWISNWYPEHTWQKVYLYMIPGGTFFFAFISGFLFAHLNVNTFRYADFIGKKWRNIASPYLFLSIPVICLAVVIQYPGYFVDERPGVYYQYIQPFMQYLLTGRVLTGYWYIPFIMLVFAVSPVLVKFYRMRNQALQLAVVVTLLVIAMFVHRSEDNLNPLQSFVYFLPVFMFGMVFNRHYALLRDNYRALPWLLLICSLALSVYQSAWLGIAHNAHKAFFEYAGADLKLVEKVMQAVAILLLFERYWHKRYRLIDLIASASFAIFFLHPIVIAVFKRVLQNSFAGFMYWHVLTFTVFFTTLLLAWFAKQVLGSYSRRVIGW